MLELPCNPISIVYRRYGKSALETALETAGTSMKSNLQWVAKNDGGCVGFLCHENRNVFNLVLAVIKKMQKIGR